MGKKALQVRKATERTIRSAPLTGEEQAHLRAHAEYEGISYHKRNPGDFGLEPPAAPRRDKTLCDEAGITSKQVATDLLRRAIDGGLASATNGAPHFPKQLWVVDEHGRVFEAMYGGSKTGRYHGYPIRSSDPLFDQVRAAWNQRNA